MHSYYLIFNLAVIIGPFLAAATLHGREYWRQGRTLVLCLMFVSLPWAVLDIWSHARGWWWYNPEYILGPRLLGLPIEEWLFFVTVPLSCLYIWHAVRAKLPARPVSLSLARFVLTGVIVSVLGLAVVTFGRERTLVDILLFVVTTIAVYRWAPITDVRFWLWNGIITGLFFIFDTMLTAIPIVLYNDTMASGFRLGTIPIEDLLYNLSFLNLLRLVYEWLADEA